MPAGKGIALDWNLATVSGADSMKHRSLPSWLLRRLDTIQIDGQCAHPLARRIGIGALGCEFNGSADVSNGLESKHASGAHHLVSQTRHGLEVNSIQGVQHHNDILLAVPQIRGNPDRGFGFCARANPVDPVAFLFR